MLRRLHSVILIGLAISFSASAQFDYTHLDKLSARFTERANRQADSTRHFGMQPWRTDQFSKPTDLNFIDSTLFYYLVEVKLMKDHLFKIEKDDFLITLDPLFDLSLSYDFSDTTSYQDSIRLKRNTRGFIVQGRIGKDVSFQSSFMENQAFFPLYMKEFVDATGVVPGQGRTKEFGVVGFDFAYSTGFVNWRPKDWLDISIGQGKTFIGHGYRSVLLSDASFNAPYIKVTARALQNKLQYTYNYSTLQTLDRLPLGEVPESLFKRKALAWQYLSYCPVPRLELGLYTAVVFERWDSTGTLPLNPLIANPVPLLNAAILGLDDRNNALVGLNLRYKLSDDIHIYSQYLIDNLSPSRTSMQFGAKYFDVLPGLDLGAEFNQVSSETYGSQYPLQGYTHFNQSLAHPSGSGFTESVAELRYQHKRWITTIRYNYITRENEFNSNILVPIESTEALDIAPGRDSYTSMFDVRVAWYMNPKTNLRIELGYTDRFDNNEFLNRNSRILSIGLKTSIFNEYYDF